MKKSLKSAILHTARFAGLFAISRFLTRGRLRILGYHGGSLGDEHDFSPGTFMTAKTFQSRLDQLRRGGYPVLPFYDAVAALRGGTLPDAACVITIDDGWYGTYTHMVPALEERGLPATLYVSTYYMDKGSQVFNMYLRYLLFKAGEGTLDLAQIDESLDATFDLGTEDGRDQAADILIDHGRKRCTDDERQAMLRRLSDILGVDWREAEAARLFTYMSAAEMATLPARGVELQLHTHRHVVPAHGSDAISREIADNRAALARIADGPFDHFCYPSGVHDPSHYPYLEAAGVRTAVTTEAGLVRSDTPVYALPRILDSEAITPIEFEAELSGFLDLVRGLGGKQENGEGMS